jgi:hypothetical protein
VDGAWPWWGANEPDEVERAPDPWLEEMKAALEEETRCWEALAEVEPVEAPLPPGEEATGSIDPWLLDAELRRLAAMRDRWDELVGHLALLVRSLGLWRELQFASFGHYCSERLGMSVRAVEQRVWLEYRLHELPGLRQAMREGRLSYEKARVVAGVADGRSVRRWIREAQGKTCIALQREAEGMHEAQACARGELAMRVPWRVGMLVSEAFQAARRTEGAWLDPEGCMLKIALHFVETWGPVLKERSTPRKRAVERDRGLCQVPGCSRAAAHAHHVRFRSAGGTDEPGNLVAICAAHHLHGVHRGWVRVHGTAPDGLVWDLGERPAAGSGASAAA